MSADERGLLVREPGHLLHKRSTPGGRKRVLHLPLAVFQERAPTRA